LVEVDGARLRWIRQRRALTPKDLADEAGVAYATVLRLQKGRRPVQLETVRRLAEALGVEPSELLVRK
jgi:transcriptional regulator with XRE-family HTH domain